MLKNGAIRDFFIQLLYDKIFLYIDDIKEINHSKFMISKERVYYQFDIQTTHGVKSDGDLNKEYGISYFIDQEEFLSERTLLNNKKNALDIIDCMSFKDMEDFINVQLAGDKIWIFEG